MGALVELKVQGNLVDRFIDGYESDSTRRNYMDAIVEFAGKLKLNTWQINIDTIKTTSLIQAQDYIKEILKEKKFSKAQKNRSALKAFWQEVIDTYELGIANVWDNRTIDKLMKNHLPKKTGLPKGKVLSTEEIGLLLESIDNTRDRLIVKIMLNTGVRRDEIGNLRWNSFHIVDGKWFAKVWGKGRKEREVYIRDEIIEDIHNWKPAIELGIEDEEMFWVGGHRINEIVQQYCKGIDIDGVTARQLRHTAATYMAKEGASSIQLQDQFGWSSITTADKYIHNVERYSNPAGALVSF